MIDMNEEMKRQGLASELADIAHRQRIIVACDEALAADLPQALAGKFADLIEEDRRDLRLIESAVTNFGVRVEPKPASRKLATAAEEVVLDKSLSHLERLGAYGMLRQNQMTCGHLVHKAAQIAKLDVKEALVPFVAVQTDFTKSIAKVNAMIEEFGIQTIMGELPATGLTGRIRDAGATVLGAVASRVAKPVEEMSVLNVLRMDHMKVKTLFREIGQEKEARQIQALFRQLRDDLRAHSLAEEKVVYAFFTRFDQDRHAEMRDEHEEIRSLLDDLDETRPATREFKERLKELQTLVEDHVQEEEDDLFSLWQDSTSHDELIRLSAEFAAAKKQLQEERAGIGAARPAGTELRPQQPSM